MSNVVEIVNKPNKNISKNSNKEAIKTERKQSSNELNNESNNELNKELDIATKLNHIMTELTKLKNGVDYQNTTMIRLSGMSDKVNLLETQLNDLAKGVALNNEGSDKTAKRQEKLEKTVIDALKNIIDNNEMGNKVVRSQIKKLSESLTKSLSFKLWKLPEISIVSVIFLVCLGLAGYLSLLHFFF